MGCGSCATGSCGSVAAVPSGCNNNGSCGTGGCNKLNSFDWLGNMDLPGTRAFNVLEVKFKGGKKEFFRNTEGLEIYTGDPLIVEMPTGYHLGYASLQGELVRLQMKKKGVADNEEVRKIYRKATDKDLEKFDQVKKRELPTMFRTREIIKSMKLEMKLSDVEFQADNSKATFYYSADDRVDFRELIKVIASEFKIRVEMRQISLRQEASRLGGIGSCGRELCCSTWLTDFKSVTTSAARYQNLSLNPSKLSGQCGRLKCCLNYELETYLDALVDIPRVEKPLGFTKGNAVLQKVDIFKKRLWFCFDNDSNWFAVEAGKVKEIIELNRSGTKADLFENIEVQENESEDGDSKGRLETNILDEDLDRLDKNREKGNRRRKKRKKKKKGPATTGENTPDNAGNNRRPKGKSPGTGNKTSNNKGGDEGSGNAQQASRKDNPSSDRPPRQNATSGEPQKKKTGSRRKSGRRRPGRGGGNKPGQGPSQDK